MKRPPSIALWILERCTPGGCDPALSGDLWEEFAGGRTRAWYWRQSLSVFAFGCRRTLRNSCNVIAFAAFWAMLAPAWLRTTENAAWRMGWNDFMRHFEFPWSSIGSAILILAVPMLFVWGGTALFLLARWGSESNYKSLSWRLFQSIQVLFLALFCLLLLSDFLPVSTVPKAELSLLGTLVDCTAASWLARIPYLATMLFLLWPARQSVNLGFGREG
jgi:hypothetical protein